LILEAASGRLFYWWVMPTDNRSELRRLQLALEAVLEDLDAIERRPHFFLQNVAGDTADGAHDRLDAFVDHFALAMKRSTSRS
jgi:hypothetical protein